MSLPVTMFSLHGPPLHDPRRDGLPARMVRPILTSSRAMRVRRQAEHHGDAAVVVERGAEDAAAAARRLVVVLDVVEQQRLAGAGALRAAA